MGLSEGRERFAGEEADMGVVRIEKPIPEERGDDPLFRQIEVCCCHKKETARL